MDLFPHPVKGSESFSTTVCILCILYFGFKYICSLLISPRGEGGHTKRGIKINRMESSHSNHPELETTRTKLGVQDEDVVEEEEEEEVIAVLMDDKNSNSSTSSIYVLARETQDPEESSSQVQVLQEKTLKKKKNKRNARGENRLMDQEDLALVREGEEVYAKLEGILSWSKWIPASFETLQDAERDILCNLKSKYKTRYVNIGPMVGDDGRDCKIWTFSINEELMGSSNSPMPILLVHGLAAGIALWAMNLDELSLNRPLFAIDLLGFGRSSRPKFTKDAEKSEEEWVSSIEAWRSVMGIEKFDLMGHSLGGYLSFSYALKHPERISHLILCDPWGFNRSPTSLKDISSVTPVRKVAAKILEPFLPLFLVRALGPFGQRLIEIIRADLIKKFATMIEDAQSKIGRYIFNCNVQNPTGEQGFHTIMVTFGWAKRPMHARIHQLEAGVNLTVIYGSKSWLDHFPLEKFQELRAGTPFESYTLEGAGHHVYADAKDEFNRIVNDVCSRDTNQNQIEERNGANKSELYSL